MRLSEKNLELANELRSLVQDRTETVSDGEGVAMFLLWGFLADHARIQNVDINSLARGQLEAFITYAAANFRDAGKP